MKLMIDSLELDELDLMIRFLQVLCKLKITQSFDVLDKTVDFKHDSFCGLCEREIGRCMCSEDDYDYHHHHDDYDDWRDRQLEEELDKEKIDG